MVVLQASEKRVLNLLQAKQGQICSRDEIAQALWGERWTEKYSNWMIDTLVYRLRHKIPINQQIATVRNQGYLLVKKGYEFKPGPARQDIFRPVPGVVATDEYLRYMNDPTKVRKILPDLFSAVKKAGLGRYLCGRLLVINSFSFDNVDAVIKWENEVVFTHYDERVLELHRRRAEELGLKNVSVLYDDIRQSRLSDQVFDLVINDFRLNFNLTHRQNQQMMIQTRRVLKRGGVVFISVVCGRRKSWFKADENLPRLCFPVAYYRQLFKHSGFKIIREFDFAEGQAWYKTMAAVRPGFEPGYLRFLLRV